MTAIYKTQAQAVVQKHLGAPLPEPKPLGTAPRFSDWAVNQHGNVILPDENGRFVDSGIRIGRRAVKY